MEYSRSVTIVRLSFKNGSQGVPQRRGLNVGPKANQTALQEEIGDLLNAVFSLCIFCKLSPRVTIGQSLTKFERRLRAVKLIAEERELINLEGLPFDELMHIWDKAKELVG